MKGPSSRILELLSLLQNGRSWSGSELAGRLGTSPRTVRRDLERLRELGYPVRSTRGPGGSYALVSGRAMPPLLLSDEEAVAVIIGLRFAALSRIDGGDGAAGTALAKLEQVVPSRLRHRMEAVSASTEAVSRAARQLDLSIVQDLAVAAHDRLEVRFDYTDRAGQVSARRVEPYRQVLLERRWYLLGWDIDRADWRTFRLDRISGVSTPGYTFVPREEPEQGSIGFVQHSARRPVSRHQGVVRFDAPLTVVSDRLMAAAGTLTAIDDTSCRYITAPDSWEWLAITLAMVDVPYVVEGPPELIARTRQLAERLARAAAG